MRCLSLDQLLEGAVEGGVVGREEGRKGQGGRAWEQAVGREVGTYVGEMAMAMGCCAKARGVKQV